MANRAQSERLQVIEAGQKREQEDKTDERLAINAGRSEQANLHRTATNRCWQRAGITTTDPYSTASISTSSTTTVALLSVRRVTKELSLAVRPVTV